METREPRALICELARQFYQLGWCTGSGGGISIREGDQVFLAPSGVQKERMAPEDIFVLDREGAIIERPTDPALRPSACQSLFYNAYDMREAGAVLHSHSVHAVLATLVYDDVFRVTQLEMIKGIRGAGFYDTLEIPIIENTAHECELTDRMAEAMARYPHADAVLVRRHGVYVWGLDWAQAKTQAECYDFLFQTAVQMKQMGIDPTYAPAPKDEITCKHIGSTISAPSAPTPSTRRASSTATSRSNRTPIKSIWTG